MKQRELQALIEATADENGRITRERLVEAASDPAHPLHQDPQFRWGDDAAAARQWRLTYAGQLIRKVYVVVRTLPERRIYAPVFVRDPKADVHEAGHVATASVPPASESARTVVCDELSRVVGALKRAASLAGTLEVPGSAEELARLLAMAKVLQSQLQGPRLAETG